jgi:hypothetical protein
MSPQISSPNVLRRTSEICKFERNFYTYFEIPKKTIISVAVTQYCKISLSSKFMAEGRPSNVGNAMLPPVSGEMSENSRVHWAIASLIGRIGAFSGRPNVERQEPLKDCELKRIAANCHHNKNLPIKLPRCPWVGCLCFFINDKTFWPWTGEFEANISDVKGLV